MAAPIVRGTIIGSALGILPGGGAMLAAFASYTVEKRVSKHPEEFGKGAIAGVAGPESANNAGAQTSFIPMLTLGIPANPVMALMIGAMIIQGIVPGPNVATEQPALFWGIIASMWIGNLMLIILNLPLIGLWVKLLTIPYYVLFPIIMAFCSIGVYSVNTNAFDLYAVAFFGLLGYVLTKLRCEPAPLLLGFVLGPLLEENLRRAMILSRGDPIDLRDAADQRRPAARRARRARRRLPAVGQEEARRGVRGGRAEVRTWQRVADVDEPGWRRHAVHTRLSSRGSTAVDSSL